MAYLFAFCRLLTGIVFLMSAVSKLRGRAAYEEFTVATRALTRLPARPVAALVVAAEVAVAPLLAWPPTMLAGFCVALGLLAAFSVAVVVALRRGRRVPCRCFGASAVPVGPGHLARNAVLIVAAAAGAVHAGTGAVPADLGAAGLAGAALAAGAAAVLLSAIGEIAGLFTSSP
ncbi:MauE/DoxX family redox-associated membrane protein [Microbispora bryophytorum]|uniref:Methylamine utilization protein MauE n=1 Tax=Microbispora bryophytorum TaxID=1460882 RepID=A0A8H9GWM2_9ACTN|nr:MauE/DoxX family redox-associated membrane protein [Microbispora bryophytorum]MBD3136157.1 methylamine utilization protein MauE [Microbispora bryophytorum]GGO04839.1 methylamine utilization protein MauE [Microbispora bryophytorum]